MPRRILSLLKIRNITNLGVVFAIFLLVSACVFSTGREAGNVDDKQSTTQTTNSSDISQNKKPEATTKNKNNDEGDFIVKHPVLKNSRFNELDQKIKTEKLLEKAADDLNKALILPNDITLRTKECGEANAEFDPNIQTITVCFELMEHYNKLFLSEKLEPQKADEKMFKAVRFAFLHEVGHALIYNYKLPVMGNEEDAADRCSSYINIEELGDEGVNSVLAAADAFKIESRQKSPTGRDMADEHLLREQRFYNSLCMIYGSNSSKYEYFVNQGYLPKERAVRCPQEYQRTVDSWVNLLKPWRKDK